MTAATPERPPHSPDDDDLTRGPWADDMDAAMSEWLKPWGQP